MKSTFPISIYVYFKLIQEAEMEENEFHYPITKNQILYNLNPNCRLEEIADKCALIYGQTKYMDTSSGFC